MILKCDGIDGMWNSCLLCSDAKVKNSRWLYATLSYCIEKEEVKFHAFLNPAEEVFRNCRVVRSSPFL